jgi:hypothetical protein
MNIIAETLPTYVYTASKPALTREEEPTQQQIQ